MLNISIIDMTFPPDISNSLETMMIEHLWFRGIRFQIIEKNRSHQRFVKPTFYSQIHQDGAMCGLQARPYPANSPRAQSYQLNRRRPWCQETQRLLMTMFQHLAEGGNMINTSSTLLKTSLLLASQSFTRFEQSVMYDGSR